MYNISINFCGESPICSVRNIQSLYVHVYTQYLYIHVHVHISYMVEYSVIVLGNVLNIFYRYILMSFTYICLFCCDLVWNGQSFSDWFGGFTLFRSLHSSASFLRLHWDMQEYLWTILNEIGLKGDIEIRSQIRELVSGQNKASCATVKTIRLALFIVLLLTP